jgi:TolB protein
MRIAIWWPDGTGVLYWVDPMASASLAADGMQLSSLRWGAKPKPLVTTLGYPDWVATAGSKALVVQGASREAYQNKWLSLCTESPATCRPIVRRSGMVSTDLAWAPGGRILAFVEARALPGSVCCFTNRTMQSWLDSHTLWIAQGGGSNVSRIRSVGGDIHDPVWTQDSRGMLFVSHNAIWIDSHVGAGNPRKVVQLFQSQAAALNYPGPNYSLFDHGHMDWNALFAWYQG